VFPGWTKRTITRARINTLACSWGREDLISYEDKHGQDDSNADKSGDVVQVIRCNCEYHRSYAAQNQASPKDIQSALNEGAHDGKYHP
jgi:hypothetical protein